MTGILPEPLSILSPGQRKSGKRLGPNLGFLLHVAPGLSPASARPYLEQCSCHVEDDEDEGEGGVPALHTADGVEKHQVSWDHEEEEDPGRA